MCSAPESGPILRQEMLTFVSYGTSYGVDFLSMGRIQHEVGQWLGGLQPIGSGGKCFCSGTGKMGSKQSTQSWPQGWAPRRTDLPSQCALVIHLSPGGLGVSWICRTWLPGEVSNLLHGLSQPGPLSPQLLFLALMDLGYLSGAGKGIA